MRIIIRVIIILISLFFAYGLVYLGLPSGVLVVLGIDIVVLLLTKKKGIAVPKEEAILKIKNNGKKIRDKMEIMGAVGGEFAASTSKLLVQGCKIAGAGIEGCYNAMGGAEGAKKAINKLAAGAGEVLKAGVTAAIAVGNTLKEVGKFASWQIEANSQEKETKQLEDAAYEIVNFFQRDND